jgi:hypothetical protein
MLAYDPCLPAGDSRELMPFEADEFFSTLQMEELEPEPEPMTLRLICSPAEACTELGFADDWAAAPLAAHGRHRSLAMRVGCAGALLLLVLLLPP